MNARRRRFGCLLLAAVVVLVPLAFGLRGTVIRIEGYRLLDRDTIAVRVTHGSLDWTRIGDVEESESLVEVEVRKSTVPLPQGAIGYPLVLTVDLEAPLGDRPVIDASSGLDIPREESP